MKKPIIVLAIALIALAAQAQQKAGNVAGIAFYNLDAFENISAKRLAEVIAAYHTVNPKELSDYLLQYAISCQGGHIVDDMTILVCSVFKNL